MMKYLLIIMAAAFAMPSMAEEDAPKRMTSAEKKAALLEKYDFSDGLNRVQAEGRTYAC